MIPDAVSKYLQSFDSVLLANHGALSYGDSLLSAYHKMESTEFYAQLLFLSKQLGGPRELTDSQVQRLYELRRAFGMTGKHPADLCQNKGHASCHACGKGGEAKSAEGSDEEALVAEITRRVLQHLGK